MRKCLGQHSCTSSEFPIAILNGTLFFPTAQIHVYKRRPRRDSLVGWWLSNLLLLKIIIIVLLSAELLIYVICLNYVCNYITFTVRVFQYILLKSYFLLSLSNYTEVPCDDYWQCCRSCGTVNTAMMTVLQVLCPMVQWIQLWWQCCRSYVLWYSEYSYDDSAAGPVVQWIQLWWQCCRSCGAVNTAVMTVLQVLWCSEYSCDDRAAGPVVQWIQLCTVNIEYFNWWCKNICMWCSTGK